MALLLGWVASALDLTWDLMLALLVSGLCLTGGLGARFRAGRVIACGGFAVDFLLLTPYALIETALNPPGEEERANYHGPEVEPYWGLPLWVFATVLLLLLLSRRFRPDGWLPLSGRWARMTAATLALAAHLAANPLTFFFLRLTDFKHGENAVVAGVLAVYCAPLWLVLMNGWRPAPGQIAHARRHA